MRFDNINEGVAKIACTKCDEVSTAKAWEKNNGFCPKCKTSSQGVAESEDTRMGTITVTSDEERKRRAKAYRDKKLKSESKQNLDQIDEISKNKTEEENYITIDEARRSSYEVFRSAQAKERNKKYRAPTQDEIDADRKKDEKGKLRPSISTKSINKKMYEAKLSSEQQDRLNDLIRYLHVVTDPEYWPDDDIDDLGPITILNIIRKEFGDKIADQVESGLDNVWHWGRRHRSSDNDYLSWRKKSRVTKSGKANKTDINALKNSMKRDKGAFAKDPSRLPESELDEVSTEKLRDYASAALQDKNKDKADKRWKYAGKATQTVADREAQAAHDRKHNTVKEALTLDYSRYMRSHGKKPRPGSGVWMFTTTDMGEPAEDDVFQFSGNLADAKRAAAKWAKGKGAYRFYVMEKTVTEDDCQCANGETTQEQLLDMLENAMISIEQDLESGKLMDAHALQLGENYLVYEALYNKIKGGADLGESANQKLDEVDWGTVGNIAMTAAPLLIPGVGVGALAGLAGRAALGALAKRGGTALIKRGLEKIAPNLMKRLGQTKAGRAATTVGGQAAVGVLNPAADGPDVDRPDSGAGQDLLGLAAQSGLSSTDLELVKKAVAARK